jgi:polysaccharide export outer membrane protein
VYRIKFAHLPFVRAALLLAGTAAALSGCALPRSGPNTSRIENAGVPGKSALSNIRVVDITPATVQAIAALHPRSSFIKELGEGQAYGTVIGIGDTLDISIWEAPPTVLFGAVSGGGLATGASDAGSGLATRSPGIPEQVVDTSGQISVPFVGRVQASGRVPTQIAAEIERRLKGKAHSPQVVVRRIANATANVTVVGDVVSSRRVPLTPTGERLLDALAMAGGTKEPIGKVTLQITRGGQVVSMPLETVIRDPAQNVRLAPNDVVTLLYMPYSFTALGAVGKSADIAFESTGMTLAQALGRIGGLDDQRSNPKGVFIFRMEHATPNVTGGVVSTPTGVAGLTPVIYRIDLRDPGSLFIAQRFEIQNRDVLFVSNAPTTDLQKFLSLLSQAAFSLTGLGNVVP